MSDQLQRWESLRELREKHGFRVPPRLRGGSQPSTAGASSKALLASKEGRDGIARLRDELGESADKVASFVVDEFPKNRELLELLVIKFASIGFRWEPRNEPHKGANGEFLRQKMYVLYQNRPVVGGVFLTLADMMLLPVEICDQYHDAVRRVAGVVRVDVECMNRTGIGYKGMSGTSWLPCTRPFPLSRRIERIVLDVGRAVFLLYDAVQHLWVKQDPAVHALIGYRVPERILKIVDPFQFVQALRPDMVLVEDEHGLRPVITELESCPAGQGMMHAMQVGYGLLPEMVATFVRFLHGRSYTVLATHEWAEYVFDQAVLVAELRKRGVDARILFDRSLDEVAACARAWVPPKGVKVPNWNTDILRRLEQSGFREFVHGVESLNALDKLRGVVFRFGYFDNYPAVCQRLAWLGSKITVLNSTSFFPESKAFMAAAQLPSVRAWIAKENQDALKVLDLSLAETRLLKKPLDPELMQDRGYWITKFAAWDGGNRSWGARSFLAGSETSTDAWRKELEARADLPHPVVTQHLINGKRWDVTYLNARGEICLLPSARTRLTPFLLRGAGGVMHAGSMITLRASTLRVHGATDAVEAPVVYTDTTEE